ncbi:MAG: ceramidase domain-containing protein [Thiobacillaceae bacterium]|jgi:hypothetical protein|nr:ceramidase domain-containing protein [Thiobacillaceae bacterium]
MNPAPMFLDIYCERTGPELWSEPLNLLSNAAFLIAAGLLLRRYLRLPADHPGRGWDRLLLILLLAAIGVGSGLWHLYAEAWAMLADVLPIAAFVCVFLAVTLARVLRASPALTVLLLLAFLALNAASLAILPGDFLNGSALYLPTWAALAALVVWLAARGHPAWRRHAWAAGLFLVSLTIRTADMALCDPWPIGTHFLWHLLNALLLYLLVDGLLRAAPAHRPSPGPV